LVFIDVLVYLSSFVSNIYIYIYLSIISFSKLSYKSGKKKVTAGYFYRSSPGWLSAAPQAM
jgi:hypothetical protein